MRKKLMICKRVLAVCLAASMVFSGSLAANAAGAAKPEDASTELSSAADGNPSKIIGLEVEPRYSTISDVNGNILATYSSTDLSVQTRTPNLPGKSEVYKDAVTGLYVYNGVYYRDKYNFTSGGSDFCYLYYPVTFFDGTSDAATGLYLVNGKYYAYYSRTADGRYYVRSDEEVIIFGSYPSDAAFEAAHGVKLDPAKEYYDYYQKDGRAFGYYRSRYVSKNNSTYFAYVSSERLLNSVKMDIDWEYLSVGENYLTPDGKLVRVGYEVEVNGTSYPYANSIVTAEGLSLSTNSYLSPAVPILKAGESATVRVRGVYYTATETVNAEGKKVTVYNTYKTGPWSDMYTYTYNGLTTKEIPALSLTAVQDKADIKLDWNRNSDVNSYMVEYIYSNTPISVTADNWSSYYRNTGNVWDAVEAVNPNLQHSGGAKTTGKTQMKLSWDTDMPYCYFVVRPYSLTKDYDIIRYVYSNVAAVAAVPQGLNTPAISGFKAVNNEDGTGITLKWTPVDAKVIIYAYEKSAFPAYYNYEMLDAYANVLDAEGNTVRKELEDALDNVTKAIVEKEIYTYKVDGMDGEKTSSLEAGKKWYFVAHTYDDTDRDVAKAAPAAVIDNIAYNFYTAMGPATNVVSAKRQIRKPTVYTLSGKTSIKLSLFGGSTGYEIYKKSGKKWKKLATTLDNHYIDEGLKEKKEYSYRVRSFYLNEDTNVKSYSDYTYVQATTGTVNAIMLTAAAKSTKSVKLSWNKVSGIEKYEIYRSDEASGDVSKYYGKYNEGNGDSYIVSDKFELVKTIKKASTTSWTDKSVKAGERYAYMIKAYYVNGKKTSFIYDYTWLDMLVGTPKMVKTVNKGSSVKVSWAKDPYAKKYEVAYMKYDAEGETDAKVYTYKTTTKTSYTIKNVEKGGYAVVRVRAIGKNGRYSGWSQVTQGVGLAGAKKVKASNVTVTTASGKKQAAVKISWQKVAGASYYMVYRSTEMPDYYADRKMYRAGGGSRIAKESNDDTGYYDEVLYEDVEGVYGSVTGTSAIDMAQLKTGVDYYYTVVAFGPTGTAIASYASYKSNSSYAYGSGSYSKVCFNTKVSVTTKVTKGKVKLTWNKIPGASKYTIYRATSKKGKYTKVATVKKGKVTWTDKKAKKGKTYYYKVVVNGKNVYKNPFEATSSIKKVKAK